jgi:hypothetical protein
MMAWLAGAHASTSRNKLAVAVLLAPWILAVQLASVWWLLVPVLLCLAWLFLVARYSFRADRSAPISRPAVLLLTALPLQLGFFLLVFQLSKASIALVDLVGRSGPGRTVLASDPSVDVDAMIRDMSKSFIGKVLEGSSDPRSAAWREQLPLLEVAGLAPDIERFPVRHQIGNIGRPWWDEKRNIKWTFSHDRMQFHGRDINGTSHGWWGTDGAGSTKRFAEVPAFGMTRAMLYAVDEESQRQHELVRLPDGEWFTGMPVRALDRILLLTNRRVLAYRPDGDALSTFAPPKLDWAIALPEAQQAPISVEVADLLDGWLVSLYYFDAMEFDGFPSFIDPWQQVVHVDPDGKTAVIGERRNIRDHQVSIGQSTAIPLASWWVSPPLYALAHAPDLLNTGLTQPPRFELLPDVPQMHLLAVALMLASLVAGYVWLRGTQARPARRRLWLASCALLGVPALLSMMCLEPRVRPVLSLPQMRTVRRRKAA